MHAKLLWGGYHLTPKSMNIGSEKFLLISSGRKVENKRGLIIMTLRVIWKVYPKIVK